MHFMLVCWFCMVLFYSFFNKNHIQSRSGAGMAAENIIVLSFNVWSCVINWSILMIVVSAHRPTHPFSSLLFPEIKTHRQAFAQVAFAIGELYCCMAPWMQHWNILKHRDGQCKTLSMWLCVNWFLSLSSVVGWFALRMVLTVGRKQMKHLDTHYSERCRPTMTCKA